jgi:hypothetical protein
MEPFAREILARLAETGEPIPLTLDQTTASDRHQILMLSVRWGEHALPLAWRVEETEGAIGFATQQELLAVVAGWLLGDLRVVLLADRFYGTHEMICVTRLRLDAALYAPAPPRRPGTKRRPRTKGKRLPNLADVLVAATCWQRVRVPGWYGQGDRPIEFCSATAVVARRAAGRTDPLGSAARSSGPPELVEGLIRRLSCAPIRHANRCRSSPGTSGAGRSR